MPCSTSKYFSIFLKDFFISSSNLCTHCGGLNLKPRDQESHAPPAEPATHFSIICTSLRFISLYSVAMIVTANKLLFCVSVACVLTPFFSVSCSIPLNLLFWFFSGSYILSSASLREGIELLLLLQNVCLCIEGQSVYKILRSHFFFRTAVEPVLSCPQSDSPSGSPGLSRGPVSGKSTFFSKSLRSFILISLGFE